MNRVLGLVIAVGGCVLATTADASLLARNISGTPGVTDAYYDTDLNITWLRDANYAATSGFAVGGLMDFATAQSWAAGLNINGVTGWSVAGIARPDSSCSDPSSSTGFTCTGGALGHMFYNEMGGTGSTAISASHNANYDLFVNLGDSSYWSATPLPLIEDSRNLAFFFTEALDVFGTPAGYVSLDFQTHTKLAWAVHAGDIDLPEPGSLAMLGSGLIIMAVRRRYRNAR